MSNFATRKATDRSSRLVRDQYSSTRVDALSATELKQLQKTMRLGDEFGKLVVPREWVAAGTLQRPSSRTADLRSALPSSIAVDSDAGQDMLCSLMRAALAMRLYDHLRLYKNHTPIQYSTWINRVQILVRFAKLVLCKSKMHGPFFQRINAEIINTYLTKFKYTSTTIEHLSVIHEAGLLTDWFPRPLSPPGIAPENVSNGDKSLRDDPQSTPKPFQPLPDQFVNEGGQRAIWFIENLGASLLDCLEACNSEEIILLNNGRRNHARTLIVKKWLWSDPYGAPIDRLPYLVLYGGKPIRWCDPEGIEQAKTSKAGLITYQQLLLLVNLLQGCHLFVTSLAFGSRASEHASLRTGAVIEGPGDASFVRGRTFKLAYVRGGVTQDWPLSPLVALAIKQQERLSLIVRNSSAIKRGDKAPFNGAGEPLWVKSKALFMSTRIDDSDDDSLPGLSSVYMSFVKAFALEKFLTPPNIFVSQHRFRKTVARLVAIALVNAPEVLMMLFGHRAIEMTWTYIQTDRELQAEISQLATNLMILNGVKVIENSDTNGGPAAAGIRAFVKAEKARHGVTILSKEQLFEGAITLTAGGRIGNLVRPGVICMKSPGDFGPCTQARGEPDPARCQSKCDGRLDLGTIKFRQEIEANLQFLVEKYRAADSQQDEFALSWTKGQIFANLSRFDDIEKKWRSDPTVAAIFQNDRGA